jgi:protein ImuB
MSWRVGCAIIPEFALRVRAESLKIDERDGPIALVDTKEHSRVKEVNQAASSAGVRIGQTSQRARARCPELRCLKWDESLIADAVIRVSTVLSGVVPGIEPISDLIGGYWLDARGMRWLGGEVGLAHRAIQEVQNSGYSGMRIGIADTLLVAQAASFRTTLNDPVRIVTSGTDLTFLQNASLDEVPIDPAIRETLRALGLSQVRDLLKLPEGSLATRFGAAGQQALSFAHGQDYRRVTALVAPDPPEAVLVLDDPVAEAGMLIFGVRGVADELSKQLGENGISASCLALIFSLDDHREVTDALSPSRPIQHTEAIFDLVRERLERRASQPFLSPVIEVRLRAVEVVPTMGQQIHIGADRWDSNALERALDRLQGRFGETVVFEPVRHDALRAERSGRWSPVLEVPLMSEQQGDSTQWDQRMSPVRRCITTPPQIHVHTDTSGRPKRLRWRGEWRSVDARGPERVSGQWWSGDRHAYEDYRAALSSHEVLWIRRDALTGHWSLQGWFD